MFEITWLYLRVYSLGGYLAGSPLPFTMFISPPHEYTLEGYRSERWIILCFQLPYLGIYAYIHALHMVAPTHASIQPHGMGNTPHALYARSQPSFIWSLWFKWHLHGRLQYTCPLATLHIDRVRLHTQPATLDTFTISIRTMAFATKHSGACEALVYRRTFIFRRVECTLTGRFVYSLFPGFFGSCRRPVAEKG